jgi:hypothetical protein
MIDCNTSTDILYKKSAKQPYVSLDQYRYKFIPDTLLNKPKLGFIPMEILVSPPGIDPGSLDFQSSAMTSSAKETTMVPGDGFEPPTASV